jgi:peptidoglycan/LPS O-acetylase OafA/YrhL
VRKETIGERFASGPNALNLVRLLLALEVLGWHSVALRGVEVPGRLHHFFADVGVDSFFALSGFLITAAWLRRPSLPRFALARARRLLPALWVCLVLTAFVIVPIACRVADRPPPTAGQSLHYVLSNAGVWVREWGIADTTRPLHDPGWNGSLWSLFWECLCYAAVALLGLAGLLRRRVVVGLAVTFWSMATVAALVGIPPDVGAIEIWMPYRGGLMFFLGAAAWCCRDAIPLDGRLALLALASLPMSLFVTDTYRVVAAPGLAYLCLWTGLVLARWPRTRIRNDLSYGIYIYGFPIQQALILTGVWGVSSSWWRLTSLSLAMVVPLAAASWLLIERPVLQAGRRSRVIAPAAVPVEAGMG